MKLTALQLKIINKLRAANSYAGKFRGYQEAIGGSSNDIYVRIGVEHLEFMIKNRIIALSDIKGRVYFKHLTVMSGRQKYSKDCRDETVVCNLYVVGFIKEFGEHTDVLWIDNRGIIRDSNRRILGNIMMGPEDKYDRPKTPANLDLALITFNEQYSYSEHEY